MPMFEDLNPRILSAVLNPQKTIVLLAPNGALLFLCTNTDFQILTKAATFFGGKP